MNNEKKDDMSNIRILIIEDSLPVQKLTKTIVDFHQKHNTVFANNGKVALEHINSLPPFNLILVDLDMPVMGGEECIKLIRELDDPNKANVTVVACTGNAKEYTPEQFKDMGFDDLFVKPINAQKLLSLINKTLDEERKTSL